MKNLFTISLICLINSVLFSQKNEIYKGSFIDDNGIEGTSTYSYYEKDYNKIKNGSFQFNFSKNGVNRELNGQFIDGRRNGLWTSSLSGRGISTTITGSFINGFPNGKFSYLSKYNGEIYQIMEVQFKNGIVIGEFLFEDKRKNEKVNGKLTDLGYMEGEWKIIENGVEYIHKFEDGVFTIYVERNLSDGKVTTKQDYTLPIQGLKKEDIVTKNTQWKLTNERDPYGIYFQKYLWSNWDLNSVGGIDENSLNGMFFSRQTPKESLSKLNLLDINFYNIDLNKQNSIEDIFRNTNYKLKEINSEKKLFENNKDLILSRELKLRDSIIDILDKVISYESKYNILNE